jgi:hypothetical protein
MYNNDDIIMLCTVLFILVLLYCNTEINLGENSIRVILVLHN